MKPAVDTDPSFLLQLIGISLIIDVTYVGRTSIASQTRGKLSSTSGPLRDHRSVRIVILMATHFADVSDVELHMSTASIRHSFRIHGHRWLRSWSTTHSAFVSVPKFVKYPYKDLVRIRMGRFRDA